MLKIVINKENRSYKKEMNLKLLHVYCKNNEIHLITAAVRTFFASYQLTSIGGHRRAQAGTGGSAGTAYGGDNTCIVLMVAILVSIK